VDWHAMCLGDSSEGVVLTNSDNCRQDDTFFWEYAGRDY